MRKSLEIKGIRGLLAAKQGRCCKFGLLTPIFGFAIVKFRKG